MRIVMLSWEYPPRIVGGISPHVHELSNELVKRGIEVHVVTKATALAPDEEIEPTGIHVHRVHLEKEPDNFIHEIQLLNQATENCCRRLLEQWQPEGKPTLFHAHDWLSLDAARELKYEYKLPLVATIHATEKGRYGGIYNGTQTYIHEQEYWLSYEAWRVIVCSEYMRNEVIQAFNCPHQKVKVVYNGINTEKFEFEWEDTELAKWRAHYGRPDEKIIMYVGRFVREKGIHVLLNAASVVLAKEPNTKFLIVGGGHREHYEKFVRWYGLQDKVLFTGFMANRSLHQLYRAADVAVFPSLYEPFGIVALEGMAAGTPVVASDAGGLKEIVVHNQTGTSSYAGDPQSLAWAIIKVLQDEKRAKTLTQNAKKRLEEDFSWSKLAVQTEAVYQQVWSEFLASHWAEETLWAIKPKTELDQEKMKKFKTLKKMTGRRKSLIKPESRISIPASSILLNERQALKTDTELHENDEENTSSSLAS